MTDETRRYACGPIPVDVTLPEGICSPMGLRQRELRN
jgi:hypothetical protein